MKQEITVAFGLQECSKCEYKLRCEECANNPKAVKERIKYELNCFVTRLDARMYGTLKDEIVIAKFRDELFKFYDEFMEERK